MRGTPVFKYYKHGKKRDIIMTYSQAIKLPLTKRYLNCRIVRTVGIVKEKVSSLYTGRLYIGAEAY